MAIKDWRKREYFGTSFDRRSIQVVEYYLSALGRKFVTEVQKKIVVHLVPKHSIEEPTTECGEVELCFWPFDFERQSNLDDREQRHAVLAALHSALSWLAGIYGWNIQLLETARAAVKSTDVVYSGLVFNRWTPHPIHPVEVNLRFVFNDERVNINAQVRRIGGTVRREVFACWRPVREDVVRRLAGKISWIGRKSELLITASSLAWGESDCVVNLEDSICEVLSESDSVAARSRSSTG